MNAYCIVCYTTQLQKVESLSAIISVVYIDFYRAYVALYKEGVHA